MISSWSATASTSISRWLESSTVPPRSAKSRSRPRIQRMPSGSRPLAGSSRISTSGSPSSACASPSRWRMPSEYCLTRLRGGALVQPDERRAARRRARPARRSSGPRRRAPRGRGGRRAGREASSSTPTRRPGVRQLGRSGAPSTAESPASGAERPTSMRIVVVLPAPLGPRNPVTVPGSQRNETSLTTVRPPRRFVSPVASIMASDRSSAGVATTAARSMPGSTSVGGPTPPSGVHFGRAMTTRRSHAPRRPAGGARRQALRARLDRRRRDDPARARRRRDRARRDREPAPPTTMVFLDLLLGLVAVAALWWRRRWPLAVALLTVGARRWSRRSPRAPGCSRCSTSRCAGRGGRSSIATAAGLAVGVVVPLHLRRPASSRTSSRSCSAARSRCW